MAHPNEIELGDLVEWSRDGEIHTGRVLDIKRAKSILWVPRTNFHIHGNPDDPAALIEVLTLTDAGLVSAGFLTAYNFSMIHKIVEIDDDDEQLLQIRSANKQVITKHSDYGTISRRACLFNVQESKATTEDKKRNVGLVRGYMAAKSLDRGDDIIESGAFDATIADHIKRERPIRILFQHNRNALPLGHADPKSVHEDDFGWLITAEIDLDTQMGREVFSLIKKGSISDFSIGFTIDKDEIREDGVRLIKQATLWEVSAVVEPMNPDANMLSVSQKAHSAFESKTVGSFLDLPLAEIDRPWDGEAAVQRIREFTESLEEPSGDYRAGFLWWDGSAPELFGSYSLPYADVIDGELKAVPRALSTIAGILNGAQGGFQRASETELDSIKSVVKRYFEKINREFPDSGFSDAEDLFKSFDCSKFLGDVVEMTQVRDVERYLKNHGLSQSQAKMAISKMKEVLREEGKENLRDEDAQPSGRDVTPSDPCDVAELKKLLSGFRDEIKS